MNVLAQMGNVCVKALSLHCQPIEVIKGGKYGEIAANLDKLAECKEQLANLSNVKCYFLKDMSQYDFLCDIIKTNGMATQQIACIIDFDDKLKFTDFAIEDITRMSQAMLGETRSIGKYTLVFLMAIRNNRTTNANINLCNLERLMKLATSNFVEQLAKNFDKVPATKVAELANIQNFAIDTWNIGNNVTFAEALDEILDENMVAFLRYAARFYEIEWCKARKCTNPKMALHLLSKLYLEKIRVLENPENKMAQIIALAQRTCFEVKTLAGFYKHFTPEFFNTRIRDIDYLNASMGNRYSGLLEKVSSTAVINLIERCLLNRKFAFLKLFEEMVDKINEMMLPNAMLLSEQAFECVNFNEINSKDFAELVKYSWRNDTIVEGMKLTPRELIELRKSSVNGVSLLYSVLEGKIDNKVLIVRQLANCNYRFGANEQTLRIAKKLSAMAPARRLERLGFACEMNVLIDILSLSDDYDSLIADAKTENELAFVYRNRETIDTSKSLAENLEDFFVTDEDCRKMFELLQLSNEFMEKYNTTIREFCLAGNASIVVAYHKGIDKERQENILRIAKAAMSGKMREFKFYELDKEIEYALSSEEKAEWMNNNSINAAISTWESYSFEDTMNIGTKPSRTCMKYDDGQYRECLLANFDSNKKVLFAKKGGQIVGRAIIRLTKSLNQNETAKSGVEFLDVESDTMESEDSSLRNEKLTIFIERPYFAFVSDEEQAKIKEMFCQMVKAKADKMGARFLASSSYGDVSGMSSVNMNVFISHTKNGYQYMDSFGGRNELRNEASYDSCSCYTK